MYVVVGGGGWVERGKESKQFREESVVARRSGIIGTVACTLAARIMDLSKCKLLTRSALLSLSAGTRASLSLS